MKVHRRIKKPLSNRPSVDSTTTNLSARFFELGGANDPLNPYGQNPWDAATGKIAPLPEFNYGEQYPNPNQFTNNKPNFAEMQGVTGKRLDLNTLNPNPSTDAQVRASLLPEATANPYGRNPWDVAADKTTPIPKLDYGQQNTEANMFSNAKPDFNQMATDMKAKMSEEYKSLKEIAGTNTPGSTVNTENQIEEEQPFQFFNPYGGADATSSAHLLGQTFENEGSTKNTLTGIAAGANILAKIGRPMVAGMGYAKRNRESAKEIEEKNRRSMIGRYNEAYAEGGETEEGNTFNFGFEGDMADENAEFMPELLTGDYSTGSKEQPANAEVEKNEYLKTPDGNVTKVVGDTHEQEGEKMNLPDKTRIVSDHLTFSKDQIKALKEEFDIKVSTKDTYAKGMDKIYQSIGLKDLIEEQEEIIESIKKIKEKAGKDKEDATSNVNLEFLSSKLKDIEDEKKPLQKKGSEMFDKIYEMQEASKPKERVEENPTEFKIGGKVFSEQDIYRVAEEKGIDKARALEIIKKFHDGGEAHNKKYGVGHENSAHGNSTFTGLENANKQDVNVPKQPWSDEAGRYAGDVTPDNYITALLNLEEQFPELFAETYDVIKDDKGTITSIKPKEGKSHESMQRGMDKTYDDLIEEVKVRIQDPTKQKAAIDLIKAEKFNEEGRYTKFDNKMGNFTATRRNFKLEDVIEEVETKTTPAATPAATAENATAATSPALTEEQKARAKGIYMLPDQSPLPPGAFQPSLKAERRYGRIDPALMTPDTQLTEIRRSAAEAEKQLANLPSGQREAALIGLQGNVQGQVDKVMNTVEMFNKQAEQQADAINLRQGDREEDARIVDMMSYEQRTLGALANTEDDYRRYWNEGIARNAQNFKTIEDLNLMNALYENFDITNDGIVVAGKGGLDGQALLDSQITKQAIAAGQQVPSTVTKTTRKKDSTLTRNAESGGMIRKFKRNARK